MDSDDYDYNQHNYNRPKRSELLGLLLIFAVVGLITFFTLPTFSDLEKNYYIPIPIPGPMTIKEGMGIGIQNKEHEDLIYQVREDLKINPSLSIEIFVGPYQNITGEGVMLPLINPPGVLILIDQDLYQVLTTEERRAIIAHELGHLTNEEMLTLNSVTTTRFQIEADTYATKYADPTAVISFIDKIIARRGGIKSRDYEPRIQNLKKIKRSQQAH